MESRHTSRTKEWFMIAIFSIGFCVFAELGVRFLVAISPNDRDPILGLRPNSGADADLRGYRNREALATATVVALGNSMTLGGNATREEAWPQVYGVLATTTVYNMGASSYGTVQYFALLDRAIALAPRVVVIGFYTGNDVIGSYDMAYENEYWKWLRSEEYQPDEEAGGIPDERIVVSMGIESGTLSYRTHELALRLREHSMAFARFADITRTLRERIGAAQTEEDNAKSRNLLAERRPDLVLSVEDKGIETSLNPVQQFEAIDLSRTKTEEGWRITRTLLREMSERAKQAGVKLVVMVIPTKEEVYLDYFRATKMVIPEGFSEYHSASVRLNEAIREFCSNEHIECFSSLPALSAALLRGERIFSNSKESHPLPAGYRVIAEVLDAHLRK